MDPYLEARWRDVHTSLATACRNALNQSLPDDLVARVEERVAIETDEGVRRVAPDAQVYEQVNIASATAGATAVALAPYRLVALAEATTQRFVKILDAEGETLITVIEFLSPANKTGKDMEVFIAKREDLLDGGVSIVEIDLIRTGDWEELLSPHFCPPYALTAYRATIRVPNDPLAVHLQPIPLSEPLPEIKIPLRQNEPPIQLQLQPLLNQVYDTGRYGRTINYTIPPVPPLQADDDVWADELLRRAGLRK